VSAEKTVGVRRVSLDVSVQILGRIGNLLLGVVVTLVLVRALGTSGFGAWSAIVAVSQIAANFGELGLGQVAVSRAAAEPQHATRWLSSLLSLRLLLAVPIALASVVAVLLVAPTPASRIAGVLISCVLLVSAPTALKAVFQLRIRNDISIALMTINSVVWTAAVLVVAAMAGGIAAFAAALLAVSALTSASTVLVARRITPISLRDTRQLWMPLLRVGLGVGIAGIFVTSYVMLDQVLVLEFAGSRQAGLYGAAYRILEQVQFIPISVMTTIFPIVAAAYPGNVDRVRALLQSAAEYLAMGSLPILAFTIVAAEPIMKLLFGSKFVGAAPALPILMGAFVCISFGYVAGNMIVILELQRRFLTNAALALILNAVLNVILIPSYGFLAAAWVTVATELLVTSLTLRSVLAALEMKLRMPRLARTAAAAAIMGGVTWAARTAGVPLAGLIAVGGLVYIAAITVLRVVSLSEVVALLRKDSLPEPG
jgi:O-antigen/teichoic acid export membrane protein